MNTIIWRKVFKLSNNEVNYVRTIIEQKYKSLKLVVSDDNTIVLANRLCYIIIERAKNNASLFAVTARVKKGVNSGFAKNWAWCIFDGLVRTVSNYAQLMIIAGNCNGVWVYLPKRAA